MKIKVFRQLLKKEKIDLALVINSTLQDPNFFYFSGVKPESALLLISNKFPSKIYCSPLECAQLKSKSNIKSFYEYNKKTLEKIQLLIKKHKITKVGLNYSIITVNELKWLRKSFKGVKFIDISYFLIKFRAIKSLLEIKLYKKASKLTENIWEKTIIQIKKQRLKTEMDVHNFIKNEAKKLGCENSFSTIVASGKNSAIPHYVPQNRKLAKGFCVVDFGINYRGYCTDITRTFFIGKPSKKEEELYQLVYNAKEHASSIIKQGVSCSHVTKKTRLFLGKYNKYFTHGLGHGIGLVIHELPNLKVKSKEKFKENMVFTIEPGIYLPNKFGIRVEDDHVLTKKGVMKLTQAPKNLLVIHK
jgi:Xaa-Pro aminopeptidase